MLLLVSFDSARLRLSNWEAWATRPSYSLSNPIKMDLISFPFYSYDHCFPPPPHTHAHTLHANYISGLYKKWNDSGVIPTPEWQFRNPDWCSWRDRTPLSSEELLPCCVPLSVNKKEGRVGKSVAFLQHALPAMLCPFTFPHLCQ